MMKRVEWKNLRSTFFITEGKIFYLRDEKFFLEEEVSEPRRGSSWVVKKFFVGGSKMRFFLDKHFKKAIFVASLTELF